MKWHLFYIVAVYFSLGAIGISFINRKRTDPEEKSNRWLKYFIYFIIVNGIVLSLLYDIGFSFVAAIILTIGLYEIIMVWKTTQLKNNSILFISISLFLFFSFGFLQYSFIKGDNKQLFVYVLVFTFDGFSQITGQLFGKHKFISKISPNKTLEGVLGGYFTSVITSILIGHYFGLSFLMSILFSLLICTSALLGDLMASHYKRICGVKDYSKVIPAHGGILDRFDSFILAGTTYWLLSL